ncbi:MAG: OmpH family outer membrane protein [Syntrophales bacterium]|nr:OmpH family outer membrane protein [Syntrophales bacterium]MDD4338152.1 OmpH family outer membrane protein [Syntrophales bacterium]HOG07179.1 OmpH family outer membrane protein [Syntrophales bacterium]HOS76504.1 OmpH family outer membrane protein [Syntrophales bacterium]HPB69332.1 OmpH family outer membrane protein [Syntrophales bacterium]
MKRFLLLSLGGMLCLALLICIPEVQAAEKTGFIDMREVMLNSEAGKKATEEFKKIYERDKASIQEKETELRKLKDDLEKQRSILKEEAYREKEAAYQKKFRDYQLLVKDANEDLQARDQELSRTLIPEILKVVGAIGEKESYTLVLDIGTVPVAYFNKENDLTKRVIEAFNKTYKPKTP